MTAGHDGRDILHVRAYPVEFTHNKEYNISNNH